jgi:Immunity protein 53
MLCKEGTSNLPLNSRSSDDDLAWLQDWYARQCNGDWEETYGVEIQSLDNPGWDVVIDLHGTALEARAFDTLLVTDGDPPTAANGNLGGPSWLVCKIRDGRFNGSGDPTRLNSIIRCFREWVGKA